MQEILKTTWDVKNLQTMGYLPYQLVSRISFINSMSTICVSMLEVSSEWLLATVPKADKAAPGTGGLLLVIHCLLDFWGMQPPPQKINP